MSQNKTFLVTFTLFESLRLVFTFSVSGHEGLAQVQGMCSLTGSCTLSKDGGLGTAYTMAHETGHK